MNKIWIIVRKEWREILKNKLIVWTSLLLPVVFIAMTVGTLYFMERGAPSNGNGGLNVGPLLQQPQFAGMSEQSLIEVLLLNQYLFYYLLIPLMIPLFVAVYSIIGEKQQRTLEPLLATPVTVWELLLGKMLSGVIPAVIVTWISYALTVLISFFLVNREVMLVMVSAGWLMAIFLMAPLLSVTAVTVGVIISSRVNDVRLAEQLGGILVLPIIALTIPVLMGKLMVGIALFLIASAVVLLLDVGLLYAGVKLFQRETILTRWK